MSNLRRAAEIALDAIGDVYLCLNNYHVPYTPPILEVAEMSLKEALAQPEQEPVAWRWSESGGARWFDWTADWTYHDRAKTLGCKMEYAYTIPLYSRPEPISENHQLGAERIDMSDLEYRTDDWRPGDDPLTCAERYLVVHRGGNGDIYVGTREGGERIARMVRFRLANGGASNNRRLRAAIIELEAALAELPNSAKA